MNRQRKLSPCLFLYRVIFYTIRKLIAIGCFAFDTEYQ